MPREDTQLLSFLASRYEQAQRELDELRQRGLEIVIAACVSERRSARPSSAVAIDTSALSEADIPSRPRPRPTAVEAEPQEKEEVPLPPEPEEEGEGSWEWPAQEAPTIESDLPDLDQKPEANAEEPETSERAPASSPEPPKPAPPVSEEPAAEDVRGAWKPPAGG